MTNPSSRSMVWVILALACVPRFAAAAAVFALSAVASALVVAIRFEWGRIAVRVVGSWLAASGLLWLGWAARSPG